MIKSNLTKKKKILLGSSTGFAVLLVLALIVRSNFALASNLAILAVVILVFPYTLHKFMRIKKIKAYEAEFPNFLRDLAESQRAGLTIVQAIRTSSKSEYGALTGEVRKINNQLSWNIRLEDVLGMFRRRMSESKIITRSLMIIDQSSKSGGNVENTMESLAGNIESLRNVQEERSTLLSQHVVMMYAIFFIFLGISIALIKFLVPLLQTQTDTGGVGLGLANFNPNPCHICVSSSNAACMGCEAFFTVSAAFDLGPKEQAVSYYRALFFTMIMVQGFFSGLIAGQIGSDSVVAGFKHSLIMLLAGLIIFISVVKLGVV